VQKVLGCFQEWLAYSEKPMENLTSEKEVNGLTQLLSGVDEFQPRKVEELVPEMDILLDTYIIYPTGGYHPFYGVPNTPPIYQQKIWPYIKRIKFSEKFKTEKKRNNIRKANMNNSQTIEQLNPTFHRGYFQVCLLLKTYYQKNDYSVLDKNGKHSVSKARRKQTRTIHGLVAKAWVPNPSPEKFDIVMHINDDSTNYLRENLKWGNVKINSKGRKKHKDTQQQRYLDLVNKGIIKG
jgi:hypothetical protein